MTDVDLLARLREVAANQRRSTVELLGLLDEVEARKLHLEQGCSSLFSYCTSVLRFSEHEAYHRIQAAHVVRRFPDVLGLVESGELTLTSITLLSPHLTVENSTKLLRQACGKTKRQIEELVAGLAPQSTVRTLVRRLQVPPAAETAERTLDLDPAPTTSSGAFTGRLDGPDAHYVGGTSSSTGQKAGDQSVSAVAESPRVATETSSQDQQSPWPPASPRALLTALAPDRYLLRLTITAETHTKLRYAQNLARHSVPSGDLATILDRALTLFVRDLERVKLARVDMPRSGQVRRPRPSLRAGGRSRRIPAEVRRAVWVRDGGRCTFVGPAGVCGSAAWLEFHHLVPFAAGGPPTVANITLRCRAHNQYEAERDFGLGAQSLTR